MVRVTQPSGGNTQLGQDDQSQIKAVRVLKPPGGGSSISFGGDDDVYMPRKASSNTPPTVESPKPAESPKTDSPKSEEIIKPVDTSSSEDSPKSPEKPVAEQSSESNGTSISVVENKTVETISTESVKMDSVVEKLEDVKVTNGVSNGVNGHTQQNGSSKQNGASNGKPESFPEVSFKSADAQPGVERSVSTEAPKSPDTKDRLFGAEGAKQQVSKATPSNHHMRSSIFTGDDSEYPKTPKSAPSVSAPKGAPVQAAPQRVRQPPGGFSTKLW